MIQIAETNIVEVTVNNFDKYRNHLKELLYQNMESHYNAGKVTDEYFKIKVDEIKDYIAEQRAIVFVYVMKEEVKGCIWAYPKTFLDEKRLFIQLLQVHPKSRNLGIGKNLLYKIEKYARANDYDAIDLITATTNLGALKFYQREGFKSERIQLCKFI